MAEKKKCPNCGHSEIGKGKFSGYAALCPVGKIMSTGSPIIVDVCTNCGLILQMSVKYPEKFKTKS